MAASVTGSRDVSRGEFSNLFGVLCVFLNLGICRDEKNAVAPFTQRGKLVRAGRVTYPQSCST